MNRDQLDEFIDFLDDIECSERSEMECQFRDPNFYAAGVSCGVFETINRVREWLNDPTKGIT